LVAAHW